MPQFLLKGFTAGKKSQLFVYDKATGKQFRTKPHNVAAEAGFYDIEFPGGIATMEPFLAKSSHHLIRRVHMKSLLQTVSKLVR